MAWSRRLKKTGSTKIDTAYDDYRASAKRIAAQARANGACGNQARAARWLGLSRLTLRQKLTGSGLRQST